MIAVAVVLHALRFYTLERWPPKDTADLLANTLQFGALYAPSVRDGEWWRVITYAFEHGGRIHLLFNMLAIYSLGIPLERRIGTVRFLQLSFVVCLGSAALVLLLPGAGGPVPTVGASGVIFGWAGALLFLLGRAQVRELGRLLLLNALISLLPGVSWQGHLGGFLFGLPCGFILRREPEAFSARAPILAAVAGSLAIYAVYHSGAF
jgi:membrane associated rhomboid family serine protease